MSSAKSRRRVERGFCLDDFMPRQQVESLSDNASSKAGAHTKGSLVDSTTDSSSAVSRRLRLAGLRHCLHRPTSDGLISSDVLAHIHGLSVRQYPCSRNPIIWRLKQGKHYWKAKPKIVECHQTTDDIYSRPAGPDDSPESQPRGFRIDPIGRFLH